VGAVVSTRADHIRAEARSGQRDGAVVGFSANTAIAEATSLYLRYEGDISGRTARMPSPPACA